RGAISRSDVDRASHRSRQGLRRVATGGLYQRRLLILHDMSLLRSIASPSRRIVRLAAPLLVALLLVHSGSGQGPKFYPDDPLSREPDTQDASKVQPWEIVLTPDLTSNLFGQPGDQVTGTRAQNVNTADEVPDSSWFTNRVYAREL